MDKWLERLTNIQKFTSYFESGLNLTNPSLNELAELQIITFSDICLEVKQALCSLLNFQGLNQYHCWMINHDTVM